MTITRVGSNDAYSSGWEVAFGGKKQKALTAKSSNQEAAKLPAATKGKKGTASVELKVEGKQPAAKKTKDATAHAAPKKPAAKKSPAKKQASKKTAAKGRA